MGECERHDEMGSDWRKVRKEEARAKAWLVQHWPEAAPKCPCLR